MDKKGKGKRVNGHGNVTFGSEEIRPVKYFERSKKKNWQGVRWKENRRRRLDFHQGIWRRQIGMKKREEFRERVRAEIRWKTRWAAKLLEVWVKRLISKS